jgi:hypothetical protein
MERRIVKSPRGLQQEKQLVSSYVWLIGACAILGLIFITGALSAIDIEIVHGNDRNYQGINPGLFFGYIVVGILSGTAVGTALYLKLSKRQRLAIEETEKSDSRSRELLSQTMAQLQGYVSMSQDVDIATFRDARIGELITQFDQEISGRLAGWMEHSFAIQGYGLGVRVGGLGLGIGQVSVPGVSTFDANLSGSVRSSQLADGFVAVFDYKDSSGRDDTVRVVCPSEPVIREGVRQALQALSSRLPEGTHTKSEFLSTSERLSHTFLCEASYASDRLRAILRMRADDRPSVTLRAAPITDHIVFCGEIEVEGDRRPLQLFPLGLLQRVVPLVEQFSSV